MYYIPCLKEIFPSNIKFIKDTEENRNACLDKFPEDKIINYGLKKDFYSDYSYIKIDTLKKTWKPSLTFEWLYRDKPEIMSQEEFNNL